jgi:hypothetical protein
MGFCVGGVKHRRITESHSRLSLLLRILRIPGSNLGTETNILSEDLRVSTVLPSEFRD